MSYILYDITHKQGKLNSSTIYTLYWFNTQRPSEQYEMIVDSTYRNYKQWREIIDTKLLGEYTGIKISTKMTNKKRKVLDADSKAYLEHALTEQDIVEYVSKFSRTQKETTYNSLFE